MSEIPAEKPCATIRRMAFDSPPREADPEAWVRRVHTVLRRVFRRAGRGSIQRVEAALGIFSGSFRQWRKRGQLELDMLFRALEELGVDPARFWVEVFGGDSDPVHLAKRPTAPPRDSVVRRAVARWHGPPPEKSTAMIEQRWRRLDGLRGEDPRLAVRRLKAELKHADPPWIPRLLAAYGSDRRAQARLDQALEALHYALLLAEEHDGRSACADILQRLGVAYAYTGNHTLGLLFAKEAAYEYRMAGDVRGEGRSWVDQGSRYFHLGRFDDAAAAYKAALSCLPSDEARHRFSAYQCLAVICLRKSWLHSAAKHLKDADELTSRVGRDLLALLLATKAKVAIKLENLAEAEKCFGEELAIHKVTSPIDAAVVSVELARVQLSRGRLGPALETVKSMSSLLEPLKGNAIVSGVIRELVRMVLDRMQMTDRILGQALQLIKQERARLVRRAPGET